MRRVTFTPGKCRLAALIFLLSAGPHATANQVIDGSGQQSAGNLLQVLSFDWSVPNAPIVSFRMPTGQGPEDIPCNRRGRIRHETFPYVGCDGVEDPSAHTVAVPLCELDLDGTDEVCDPVKAHVVARAKKRRKKVEEDVKAACSQ